MFFNKLFQVKLLLSDILQKLNLCIILIVSILVFYECQEQPARIDKEKEISEISNTISSCIGWFENKDFDLLFSIVANDASYLCVHPADRVIKGFDEFERNSEIFRNPDFMYVRHEIRDLNINLSKTGKVAWFYCILDDINTWNGRPANWENTRWTGVLEKRDGKWVMVQQHYSFATD